MPESRRLDRGFDLRPTDASGGERKMIMGKKSIERLMTLPELSEMLGVQIETLYGWRHRGEGPVGIGSAVTSATPARQLRNGWRCKPTVATRWVGGTVAYIERRQLEQRDRSGRTRSVVRYKVCYRDAAANRTARLNVASSTRNAEKLRSSSTSVADCGAIPVVVRYDSRSGPPSGSRPGTTSG